MVYSQNMEKNIRKDLHHKFFELLNIAREIENKPRKFGTDVLLTNTQIHLISLIGENTDLSITDLAKLKEVTKGAISQNIKKLEKLALVEKLEDSSNTSRSIVILTSKGKIAFYSHIHWHEKINSNYKEYYESINDEQVEFLLDFMKQTEMLFKSLLSNSD